MSETYYVWLVAERSEFGETLVAKMVRRGFTISPLGRQLITSSKDNPACIVAMGVSRTPRSDVERLEYTASGIHAEVCDVVKRVNGKFWGLIVSGSTECTWNIGNISLEAEKEEAHKAFKKIN